MTGEEHSHNTSSAGGDYRQAKRDVFVAAHEYFGLGYAKPDSVFFSYQACHDEGHGPFQAVIDARIKIIKPWTWEQIDEEYRKGLLRIPGWSGGTGGWKTHVDTITKGDLHIELPQIWGGEEDRKKNIYGFSIYGPCTIKQNMNEIKNDPDGPKDEYGSVGYGTDPQDYTKEFE